MDTNVDTEFNDFVVRRSPALLRVAYALTGDAEAAEDLLQRALARAFVRWRRIRGDAEPYVKRIIYRDSASRRRRPTNRVDRATLRTALLGLPHRQRTVLVLLHLEDLSVEDTAEFLGWRPGTVARQATNATATLRDLIPDDARTTERSVAHLSEVIQNLAAEGDLVRPQDRDRRRFALDATDRGYQYRNRRRAGLVGVVALIPALALAIPYGLDITRAGEARGIDPATSPTGDGTVIGRDGVPTHVITDRTEPIELVDGWYVAGNKYVLDWPDNTYARMSGESIQLSPNGEWVVTKDRQLDFTSITYRVTNLRTGHTRSYVHRRVVAEPQWSPDGNTLLFSKTPEGVAQAPTGVAVILDVTTGRTTATMLDVTGLSCAEVGCRLTWLPSGTEIALAVSRKAGANQAVEPFGVQTFTLDGARARLLPIAGIPGGPDAWSPDGRHVVVAGVAADGMNPEGRIVEVATGTVVLRMAAVITQAAWVDNDRMLIWELDITNPDNPDLVVTLRTRHGEVLQRWKPPAEMFESLGFDAAGPLAVHPGT